jgi:hypothetical protein
MIGTRFLEPADPSSVIAYAYATSVADQLLVCERNQDRRQVQTERLGGLEVDDV